MVGYLIIAFFYFCYKIFAFVASLIIVFFQFLIKAIRKFTNYIKLKLSNKQLYILNSLLFLAFALGTTYLYFKYLQKIPYMWILLLIFPCFVAYWLFRLFFTIIQEKKEREEQRKRIELEKKRLIEIEIAQKKQIVLNTLFSIERNFENFKNSDTLDATLKLYNKIKNEHIFALKSNFPEETKDKIKRIYTSAVELHEQIIMDTLSKDMIEIEKLLSKKDIRLSSSIHQKSCLLKDNIERSIETFDNLNKDSLIKNTKKLDTIIDFTKQYENIFYIEKYNYNYEFDQMTGIEFEKFCANLLIINDFINVSITRGSGDQGVDIIAQKNGIKYAIQCKRQSHKLSNKPIQEVVAGKKFYKCHGAIVMTNNQFTNGAIELAKANEVVLWDRKTILQMIYFADTKWNRLFEELKILDDNH